MLETLGHRQREATDAGPDLDGRPGARQALLDEAKDSFRVAAAGLEERPARWGILIVAGARRDVTLRAGPGEALPSSSACHEVIVTVRPPNERSATLAPMPEPRLQPSSEIVSRQVGDEVILVNLQTSEIYALNRTAARLWELLSSGAERDAAAKQMAEEFEVDSNQLNAEIDALVGELHRTGIMLGA
jgi:hypothetical protein